MNIVILGAGNIGAYLASILSKEEHNVTILDRLSERLSKIEREIDVATYLGHGSKWETLESLLENDPDLFIAVTGDDETNLIACTIAKNLGYPSTIARVKEIGFLTHSRLNFARLFFVDHFIGAEVLAAYDIIKTILNPTDLALENFAHGAIQMRTIIIPPTWKKARTLIKDLDLPQEMIISLIRRNISDVESVEEKKDQIIFPHGDDQLKVGDEVTIIGENACMQQLHQLFETPEKVIQSVVLVGGSSVAIHLAQVLEKMNVRVTLIEKDPDKCEMISELLKKSVIINHDATDLSFLLEEQMQNAGAFIACTRNDDTNLLLGLLGKEAGCREVHAMISDMSLGPILRDLGIHFSLSERVNVSNRILSIIHAKTVISIASLCDNQAKVIELKISPDSELIGLPISEISTKLPKDLLIAAIENRGRVMIGKGSRILSPNDTVIIITSPEHLHELQNYF